MHYQYEQWKEAGRPDRHPRLEGWDRYVEMLDATDPERLHQRIHQGHNCWVIDEEWDLVTPELIEATCMVGTADDLARRLDRPRRGRALARSCCCRRWPSRTTCCATSPTQVMPLLG